MQHCELRSIRCTWSMTSSSSSSSSQEAVTFTEHPTSTRSESKRDALRGDSLRRPAETENPKKKKNDHNEESKMRLVAWCARIARRTERKPGRWRVPEHRDASRSSHESPPEPRTKVVSGKHSIFTHFPKDRNCDITFENQNFGGSSQKKRTGAAVPRAASFGDLLTSDHKVPSEGCESRNSYRYAVVVQDVAAQWIQSFSCKTKTSQETEKSSQMFAQPKRKPKVMYTDNSIEFGNSVQTFFGIIVRGHRTDRELIGLLREQCAEWKEVGGFHGMFLQSAKHSWSLVCWEDTLWEAFRSSKARLFRSEREEKHKWAIGKPKLENARRLWGIYFVDPDDREFKETIKNARKKLEVLRPIFLFAVQVGSLLLDSTGGGAWLFFFGEMICLVNYLTIETFACWIVSSMILIWLLHTKIVSITQSISRQNGCARPLYVLCFAIAASFTDSVWSHLRLL